MRRAARVWLAMVLPLQVATAMAGSDITVTDPWVREVPPVSRVTAAYGVVKNGGERPRQVVAAASPWFERVELHRTVHQGQMSGMEAVPVVEVPAKGEVRLEPNGMHWMLINAVRPLPAGAVVPIALRLADGEEVVFQATVKKVENPVAAPHHPGADHDHRH